jgi:serine O-acetyltransferase
MFSTLKKDLDAIMDRDPAARGRASAMLLYPSFHVLVFHRFAHPLWQGGFHTLARWLMQLARWLTGIEIHPAARIGPGFFIDHGMGVVIGETSVVGENVTLYHGVTLGGTMPAVDASAQRHVKRHPTLGDNVIVGAGAQILGPIEVGRCARVGGNSAVTRNVPDGVTVVGVPARPLPSKKADGSFSAYALGSADVSDPTDKLLEALALELEGLRAQLADIQARQADRQPTGKSGAESDITPQA